MLYILILSSVSVHPQHIFITYGAFVSLFFVSSSLSSWQMSSLIFRLSLHPEDIKSTFRILTYIFILLGSLFYFRQSISRRRCKLCSYNSFRNFWFPFSVLLSLRLILTLLQSDYLPRFAGTISSCKLICSSPTLGLSYLI